MNLSNNKLSNTKENLNPFAEVIESSLDTFLAQSWVWDTFPSFGSLVKIDCKTHVILGCVTSITTGSIDPQRYPFPYQKTEDELKTEQPQIFEFLKTIFQVKIVGYLDLATTQKFHYTLPPTPAKIHAFVHSIPISFSANFFSNPHFLYLLFSSQNTITHFDDLLLAIFKQLEQQKKLTTKTITSFYKTFSLLTGNDYRRMKLFLHRLETLKNSS